MSEPDRTWSALRSPSPLLFETSPKAFGDSSKQMYSEGPGRGVASGACRNGFSAPNCPIRHRSGGGDLLTQAEANHLLTLPKVLKVPNVVLPASGKYQREVESTDGSEGFVLHVNRKSIKVALASHFRQKTVGLARLCLNGGPHSNPDGTKVGRTHLHVYAEGFDDRLAMDLPTNFSDPADLVVTLKEFCAFINLSAQVAEQGTLLGGAS